MSLYRFFHQLRQVTGVLIEHLTLLQSAASRFHLQNTPCFSDFLSLSVHKKQRGGITTGIDTKVNFFCHTVLLPLRRAGFIALPLYYCSKPAYLQVLFLYFSSRISLPKTPLMNLADLSVPNILASSTASLTATFTGTFSSAKRIS